MERAVQQVVVMIAVAVAIMVVVIAAALAVAHATVRDHAPCNHRERLRVALARSRPGAILANSGRQTRCLGHAPDPIDISTLRTGDVLTISYKGVRSVFASVTYRSIWTHPALVVRDPLTGEPFVFEAAVYRPPYCGGMVRVPLFNWARINRNVRAIALTRINKPASAAAIIEAFVAFERGDIGVESLRPEWLRFTRTKTPDEIPDDSFFAPPLRKKPPETRSHATYNPLRDAAEAVNIVKPSPPSETYEHVLTCHEILISVLQSAGVISRAVSPCSFLPTAFVAGAIEMASGFEYAPPVPVSVSALIDIASVDSS